MASDGVTLVAAFGGGLVSFLSPCVLPIVPAYLSVVTGLEAPELEAGGWRRNVRVLRTGGLFVAGFAAVFVLLGLTATTVGQSLFENQGLLTRLGGVAVLVMAAVLVVSAVRGTPVFGTEARFHPRAARLGPFAPPVLGAAFAFGWTPCIGPVLTSVLAVAATQGEATRGALLLAVYSAGLAVPFLLAGLMFGRLTGAFDWFKRHSTGLTAGSGLALAFLGLLLFLDRMTWATAKLQQAFDAVGLDRLVTLG